MKTIKSKQTKMSGPLCVHCGATERVPFPLFPRSGGSFGDVCEACDTALHASRHRARQVGQACAQVEAELLAAGGLE